MRQAFAWLPQPGYGSRLREGVPVVISGLWSEAGLNLEGCEAVIHKYDESAKLVVLRTVTGLAWSVPGLGDARTAKQGMMFIRVPQACVRLLATAPDGTRTQRRPALSFYEAAYLPRLVHHTPIVLHAVESGAAARDWMPKGATGAPVYALFEMRLMESASSKDEIWRDESVQRLLAMPDGDLGWCRRCAGHSWDRATWAPRWLRGCRWPLWLECVRRTFGMRDPSHPREGEMCR